MGAVLFWEMIAHGQGGWEQGERESLRTLSGLPWEHRKGGDESSDRY